MTSHIVRRARYLAAGSAILLMGLGSIVTVGWTANLPALIQIQPQLPPMTRNVAASFLLLGAALLVLAMKGPRWIAAVLAVPVLVVSCVSYADFAFGSRSGIHEILGPSYINVQLRSPGRMAPITAVSLAVASATLLCIATVLPATGLGVGLNGAVISAFGLVATLQVNPSLAALHTGLGMTVLGIGLVALAWCHAPAGPATPGWVPLAIAAAVAAMTAALFRALLVGGYAPAAPLPVLVLGIGTLLGPLLALTVYLAQRSHAQAAALARSQALLEEAQALSRTGSFWWRASTGEVTASKELHRILEIDEALPITMERLASCLEDVTRRRLLSASGDERVHIDCEQTLRFSARPDKRVHVLLHGTRHKHGELECIGAVQDITDLRESEEALSRLRSEFARVARIASLGALAGSIAHEVQQPLSASMMNASTCLRMLEADPPNLGGALMTARRSLRDATRAADVIAHLRGLFTKRPFSAESVDLNDATREVLILCAAELQRHRVQLQVFLTTESLEVSADRVQLQQVILNLLLNAAEAMSLVDDVPRILTIRTEAALGSARLSVHDLGVGLAPDVLNKLFDAFFTTKSEGMGIGLSISRSIIERHHGQLWASANEGPGATFTFSIPRTSNHGRQAAAAGAVGREAAALE